MPYTVTFTRPAAKQLEGLPQDVQARIEPRIDALEGDPHPAGSVKLSGSTSTYRIRVGDYRVVYDVDEQTRTVSVSAVRHRRDVFRRR